jgi:serine/threonine protein kinase
VILGFSEPVVIDKHIESQMSKTKLVPPFSEHVAIDIMLQVINAISHMHNKGIVHRDLKPKNVLVRSG